MSTLPPRGCFPTNQSTSINTTISRSSLLRFASRFVHCILFATASLATTGCGFQLVSSSNVPLVDGHAKSIYFKGSLNRETELGLKRYFQDRGFTIDPVSSSFIVNFDDISSNERAIRFDARGNAIEYVMRVEWSFRLSLNGDDESTTQHTLYDVSQYRVDEDALLATANQKSLARRDLVLQLSKDLLHLISSELLRSSSGRAAQ